jgi:A/G-specific adenine glycosylase
VPCDPENLATLPGLGRYTVNAILSQASDARLPILEANSRRVLCRLFAVREDPRRSDVERDLWQKAAALLPRRRVGAFNQALMELGALVCTAARPDCPRCPLQRECAAHELDLQGCIPTRPARPPLEEVQEVAVVVRRRRQILLAQRPDGGRWARMWEFPRRAVPSGATQEETAANLLAEIGVAAKLGPELMTIRHGVTRFRITLACFDAKHQGGSFRPGLYARGQWLPLERLDDFPSSTPQRRLAAALKAPAVASLY